MTPVLIRIVLADPRGPIILALLPNPDDSEAMVAASVAYTATESRRTIRRRLTIATRMLRQAIGVFS